LRGIDCPELDTAEGRAAKRFVEGLVRDATSITVTTTKPDKWDRYLCDLFLGFAVNALSHAVGEGRGEGARRVRGKAEDLFMNNLLLENGHARRHDKITPADWEHE
jgi:endonuclease YncB( thermonuclease family)